MASLTHHVQRVLLPNAVRVGLIATAASALSCATGASLDPNESDQLGFGGGFGGFGAFGNGVGANGVGNGFGGATNGPGPGFGGAPGPTPVTCGNGSLDPNEVCDGSNLGGATCASATLNAKPNGNLGCLPSCQIDVSGCSGDGTANGGNIGTGGFGGGIAGSTNGSGGTVDGAGGTVSGAGGTVSGAGGTVSGAGGTDIGAGGTQPTGGGPTLLPTATTCPTFTNGGTVQIARKNGSMMPVVIYIDPNAKSKPAPGGPIILYYHATLQTPAEVHQGFGDTNIAAVTSMGGVVAAFTTTACSGCAGTDDGYWFVEDNDVQDIVVACAIKQANIDTRHIHALGWSAGALHTDTVAMLRSNYMASVISYSGGYGPWPGTMTPQDPNNHVSSIQTYGDSSDAVVINFPTQSKQYYSTFQPKGYYTMMCNHPGGHMIDTGVAPKSLKFFMDHPYKVSPEPYASAVPSDYPSYCKNAP